MKLEWENIDKLNKNKEESCHTKLPNDIGYITITHWKDSNIHLGSFTCHFKIKAQGDHKSMSGMCEIPNVRSMITAKSLAEDYFIGMIKDRINSLNERLEFASRILDIISNDSENQ